MMPNFPFLGFPRYSRIPPNYYYGKPNANFKNRPSAYSPKDFLGNNLNNSCSNNVEKENKQTSTVCYNSASDKSSNEYEQFINIFGFKLYFDDILILLILFFLYQEDVKDSYLYIILIMLLIS